MPPRDGLIAGLIRRLWCRRRHPWRGYTMTAAEVDLYRHGSSFCTGSWNRKPCRFCKGHDDEMPRRPSDRERRYLLARESQHKLRINARIGRISHAMAPGYGDCLRCHTAWAFVKGHSTSYTETSGCFPLCEACWSELTPEERLPYYRLLWNRWCADGADREPETWGQIETAVMAGL